MSKDYVPGRELDLEAYCSNQIAKITPTPQAWGTSPSDLESYNEAFLAFSAVLAASRDPATRTHAVVVAKSDARKRVIAEARKIAATVQACREVTNSMRAQIGLTIRKEEPTPIGIPFEAPVAEVKNRLGTMVEVRVHGGTGRPRPHGVAGCALFSFVGAVPPAELKAWTFEGDCTRSTAEITFDAALPPGTTVWITAAWYNPRGQRGPACAPISTFLAGGAMAQAA